MDINNSVLPHLFSRLWEQEFPEHQSCMGKISMTLKYVHYCTCIVSQVEENLPEISTCDIFPCAAYTIVNSISSYIVLCYSYDVSSSWFFKPYSML